MVSVMIRDKYKLREVDYEKLRVSKKVIPDQALSMREIIERFVRKLPIDVPEKSKIYLDENVDYDFEKMSNLDSTDKAFQASEFRLQAEELAEEVKANERAKHERKKKADIDKAVSEAKEATQKNASGTEAKGAAEASKA